jgi:hypothetical protein
VDDQGRRHRAGAANHGHVEAVHRRADTAFDPPDQAQVGPVTEAQRGGQLPRYGERAGERGKQNHPIGRKPVTQRHGGGRAAEGVGDERAGRSVGRNDCCQRRGEFWYRRRSRSEGAGRGSAVTRCVDCHDAVAVSYQRRHERGELAAVAGPAVHEVNRRPVAPRLPDDTVARDVDSERLTRRQLGDPQSGWVPAAWQREPDALGPAGTQPGRRAFEQPEHATDRPPGTKETNDRAFLVGHGSGNSHAGTPSSQPADQVWAAASNTSTARRAR